MREVSCKVFDVFWDPLEKKGVDFESIVANTGVTLARLQSRKERLDWSEFSAVMRNLRPHFTDDEYIELGRRYLRAPGLRFAMVIARLALSPMDFYRWFSKPREGVGNQMFSCITPTHRELAPFDIELDLTLPDGFEVCWDFFLISQGNVVEMPRLLGYPAAEVTLTRLPNGGRYRIAVPKGTAFFRRIFRFLAKPFVRRDAAKELRAAHESLLDRYEELESAQLKLDRQAAQLRTAHSVNVLVQRDIDVDATLATVAKALVDEAGFTWAEVSLIGHGDNTARFGTKSDAPMIARVLEARGGEKVASLMLTPASGANRAEREELLAFITPSLAIALQNATYRSGLERLVDERTRELREAQSAREKFFGNVSHEIRTPLSIVLLAVGDIEKRAKDKMDTRSRAALGSIHDSARKLLKLVDELLLLAAGQEGKLKLAPEATNLTALVTSLVSAWTPAAEEAGLTIAANAPKPITAKVDPVAIERVLTNLVSNAVKYTPRGGAVEIELVEDNDGIRISVLDNGKGISDDLMKRLFGRFERADGEHRKITGTGIGLSLVKQLVEQHDGTVQAIARPGGGTEMRVRLPATVVMTQTKTGPILRLVEHVKSRTMPPPFAVSAPDDVAKGTILIAEDDPRLATMIADLLSDEYVVRVANDGAAALELAKQHQPNLLITDVDMPIMDGIELSKRFREVMNDRLAPIIILSAVLDLSTRVAGLDAGAVDYVTKPFDPSELRARVRSQFRQRDLAMRLHRAEQLSTLSVLTSGLAHELRNPANGVVNAIEPLKMLMPPELMKPGEPIGELIDVMGECAAQINTLSKQLLGFRDHETNLQLRPAPLRDVVERALSISRTTLEQVEVRIDIPADLIVMCAPPLLTQVFTNLFENAAHAAGKGWVSISTAVSDDFVSVIVGDSGPGVPVGMRTKIFEPFFTTKPQGVGTGLGLPVSREIAIRHGGTLEVQDRGATSVFVVQLPRHTPVDVAARVG